MATLSPPPPQLMFYWRPVCFKELASAQRGLCRPGFPAQPPGGLLRRASKMDAAQMFRQELRQKGQRTNSSRFNATVQPTPIHQK